MFPQSFVGCRGVLWSQGPSKVTQSLVLCTGEGQNRVYPSEKVTWGPENTSTNPETLGKHCLNINKQHLIGFGWGPMGLFGAMGPVRRFDPRKIDFLAIF